MSRRIPDAVAERAIARPHDIALTDGEQRWSNAQVEATTARLAGALHGQGAGSGTRIAALLVDGAATVFLIHASRRIGATLVPLNRRAAVPELREQIAVAGVDLLVHDQRHQGSAVAITAIPTMAPALALEALMSDAGDRPLEGGSSGRGPVPSVDLDAPATILFTSGSSGRPKAALLSHGNHVASAAAWAARLRPRPSDRWLSCLPLFHVAGLAMVMRTSLWGLPLTVEPHFDAEVFERAVEDGVSHASLVAPMLRQLLEQRRSHPVPPTLRAILLGGGPLSPSLLERARTAGLPIVSTYGMTETASGIAAGMPGPGTLDDPEGLRPLPGVELRVAAHGGDPGDAGEIVVEGPMVFDGYLGPSGQVEASGPAGIFATGDLGTISGDGVLHVADRRDDLIISGGENIYPAEVEAALTTHPDVAEAAVVGQPDDRWGAVPVAAIVVRPGAVVADATLETRCRDRLAHYKVPVAFHRLEVLPRNEAGKLRRADLRDSLLKDSP